MMFSVAPHISWSNVEGELVLFDDRNQSYASLNSSASDIWRGLAKGMSVDALADELAAATDADRSLVGEHVSAFVEDAVAKGLLVQAPDRP